VQHHPLCLWPLIITWATLSTTPQGHTAFTRASWLALPLVYLLHQHMTPKVGRSNGCRGHHNCSTRHLTTVQHLPLPHWLHIIACNTLSTSPLVHTPPTRASWLALPLVHLLHQHTALGGSNQTGAFATISDPHATSPLCNTTHCVSGRLSSPAPLCQPYRRGTPHPLVRVVGPGAGLPAVPAHGAQGGSIKWVP
jgi:hypothetical protein